MAASPPVGRRVPLQLEEAKFEAVAPAAFDGTRGDACGHGTALMGVLAAGYDDGVGMAGIVPQATYIPIRVLDEDCRGSARTLATGIMLAIAADAEIILISLNFHPPTSTIPADVAAALDLAHRVGAIVVGSAGNYDGSTPASPANHPHGVPVACTREGRDACDFSDVMRTARRTRRRSPFSEIRGRAGNFQRNERERGICRRSRRDDEVSDPCTHGGRCLGTAHPHRRAVK